MCKSELSRRIKELDTGKPDPESRTQLALKLHKEGYPPTSITQMMKRELGRGVPLTIFGKDTKASKSGKSKISAAKIVQTKIAQEITVEANEKVAQILETGKLIEENLAPFAKLYGYDNAGQFIVNLVFPFFDSHYKHVRELDEENRNLRSGMQSLMNILNPEARRRLCQAQVFEMMQYWTVMGQLHNHPIPPQKLC